MKILLPSAIDPVDLVGIFDRIAKFVGFALLSRGEGQRGDNLLLAAHSRFNLQLLAQPCGAYT